jgi:TolB-like protein/cytochrome c-type biogenesis protein CcmH/NrfG
VAVAAVAVIAIGAAVFFALRPAAKEKAPVAEGKPAAPLPITSSSAPATAKAVADKSIAVLPFTNMSEEKDSAFFADGVHEDILTNLALVNELKVVSRTTVTQYRDSKKSMKQIGEELGVAYILEGSVRRMGNKVRVTGQLINARTDEHVWAKSYDRDLTDIFAIQASLSQEIASALQAAITPQAQKFIERRPTENPVAYDAFLKGRDIRNKSRTGRPGPLKQAEEQFQLAVNQDPKFAAAWGELAEAHALNVFWNIDATPARLAQGDAAIATAQRLAPDSPDVMRQVGTYAYYAHRDYTAATAQYEKVARLQPNDATAFNSLALILRRQGRWAESLANTRKSLDLDPGNISYHRTLLSTLRDGRRWDEAIAEQRRLIALLPDDLAEQAYLPRLTFAATGSSQAFDEWLARLSPAQRESPRVIELRKFIAAFVKSDPAEFKRLDTLQPYFDGDGGEHYLQAGNAAIVYSAAGDSAAMRARIADFPAELRTRLEREPSNIKVMDVLASFEAMLGHTDEALRLTSRKLELLPETRDAVDGPTALYFAVCVHAMVGDKDRALAELARVLRMPGSWSAPHLIRGDPFLVALRGDPRFEALLNDPKNNAPLF